MRFKGNGYTYRGGNSIKIAIVPFRKGSTLQEKNLHPLGSTVKEKYTQGNTLFTLDKGSSLKGKNLLQMEQILSFQGRAPFRSKLVRKKANRKSQQLSLLYKKMAKIYLVYPAPLKREKVPTSMRAQYPRASISPHCPLFG